MVKSLVEEDITQIEEISERFQEYLETIYRLTLKNKEKKRNVLNNAISEYLKVKPSSVTNMLRKLAEKKLIIWEPHSKNIQLTEMGYNLGKKIVYNHILMELFLKRILGLKDHKQIHDYACELEHHIEGPIFNGFKKYVGKKNIITIEKFLEKPDPELILSEDIVIFPAPEEILSNFTSRLIKQIPEVEKIILDEKKKFLQEY
jgi:Mn-dependent DtxR family transcriptional regulator